MSSDRKELVDRYTGQIAGEVAKWLSDYLEDDNADKTADGLNSYLQKRLTPFIEDLSFWSSALSMNMVTERLDDSIMENVSIMAEKESIDRQFYYGFLQCKDVIDDCLKGGLTQWENDLQVNHKFKIGDRVKTRFSYRGEETGTITGCYGRHGPQYDILTDSGKEMLCREFEVEAAK